MSLFLCDQSCSFSSLVYSCMLTVFEEHLKLHLFCFSLLFYLLTFPQYDFSVGLAVSVTTRPIIFTLHHVCGSVDVFVCFCVYCNWSCLYVFFGLLPQ